ncbi:MAG: HEAT repeat domain-containing protein, partial [Methylocella sp.]
EALVQLKADSAVSPLIERLNDAHWNVRQAAIEALVQLKADSAVSPLIERLKDGDWVVRRAAIKALGQLKAGPAIPLMVERLRDTDSDIRMAAIESLGWFGAKQAAPALRKLLTENEDAGVEQNTARALIRMRINAPELASWQEQQLAQVAEQLASASSEQKAGIADDLGFIYHVKSIEMLVGLLADEWEYVVNKALAALGGIGAYHPEWLKPHVDRLLELSKQPKPELQDAAVAAIGQILSFAGGAPESGLGNDESRLREHLSALAKDSAQTNDLRSAAIDALGRCGRPACAEALSALLGDDRQSDLRFSVTHWLAWLHYAPALPDLQRQLDALVKENQAWREQRDKAAQQTGEGADAETDAASSASAVHQAQSENNPEQKKAKNWQQEALVFQAAYAIATIDPANAGIALLDHPLHAAREAAIQALAGRADGELIKKLVAHHQAFDPDDLPSPLPYALFRALDRALHTVEYTGTADDLKILKALKGKNIETPMKTQEDAINERFDWTLAELEHRLAPR